MKKLDKLILGSFLGPFLLTFIVVDFILLTVNMLKYFDEIFGKDLPFAIYAELIGYFVISISPMALPLAVLLSSLMTFGNLGEHFELTAIKSSGISLVRALRPIGIFVIVLTFFAFLSNNFIVPRVNLKTFSLLYDIRKKSPAFDIKEGVFYNGLPNYSIKVNRKLDEVRLNEVLIYDHTAGQGNLHVITADSGRMEPFFNDRYIMLTLYNGNSYQEGQGQRGPNAKPVTFDRTQFQTNQMVFDLDAFELERTPENLWSNSKSIKNISEIKVDLDSMGREINNWLYFNYANTEASYSYFGRTRKLLPPPDILEKKLEADSLRNLKYQEEYEQDRLDKSEEMVNNEEQEPVPERTGSPESLITQSEGDLALGEEEQDSIAEVGESNPSEVDSAAMGRRDSINNLISTDEANLAEGETEPTVRSTYQNAAKLEEEELISLSEEEKSILDSIRNTPRYMSSAASVGLTSARNIKNNFTTNKTRINNVQRDYRSFQVSWYQKYTQAFACFVLFMIGAPLGAIIKKGGLGMPVLMSIVFFIMYYMLTITGEKWGKEGLTDPFIGTWFSNLALIPFGLFFLRQARKDARLFEPDFYVDAWKKLLALLGKVKKQKKLAPDVL